MRIQSEWIAPILFGGVLALAILLRRFVQWIGASCNRCGKRMTRLSAAAPAQRSAIVEHYQRVEGRQPDLDAFFFCPGCRCVHDDFSGVQRSMTADSRSICKVCGAPIVDHLGHLWATSEIHRFQEANADRIDEVECLRCERDKLACAMCPAPSKVTGCRQCHTLYQWQEDGALQYLTALTDRPILKSVKDTTGGFT